MRRPTLAGARRSLAARARRQVRPRTLLRAQPVSRQFGLDRGQAIDRHYIEGFLARNSQLIRGRVLEIGDDRYTRRFGSAVEESEVLHAVPGEAGATLVGDLVTGEGIPESAFDCIVLTQTLPFIFDVRAAVAGCRRALADQGAVLATLPGISQISRYDMDRWGDYWRFTDLSARRLFEEAFGEGNVTVRTDGNAGAACAFIQGLATEEIPQSLLEASDPDYQLIISVVATRRGRTEGDR
jgi:hypothetical protein